MQCVPFWPDGGLATLGRHMSCAIRPEPIFLQVYMYISILLLLMDKSISLCIYMYVVLNTCCYRYFYVK